MKKFNKIRHTIFDSPHPERRFHSTILIMKTTCLNFRHSFDGLTANLQTIEAINESYDKQIELLTPFIVIEKDREKINALYDEKRRFIKVFTALDSQITMGGKLLDSLVKWDSSDEPPPFNGPARDAYNIAKVNFYKYCLPNEIDSDDLPKAYSYLKSLIQLLNSAVEQKFINAVIGKCQAELFLQDLEIADNETRLLKSFNKSKEEKQSSMAKLKIFGATLAQAEAQSSAAAATPAASADLQFQPLPT